jgi:hypothetical protein
MASVDINTPSDRHDHEYYFYYLFVIFYYLFTAIWFAPGGSSPTLVQTKTIK